MSCKRGQSSLLGLPSAADIMKRATCFMRGNAPWGVKGINGLRAFGAWHFCAGAKMPNVSIAVYVPPGRCPGLWATFGLCIMSAALGNTSKLYCPRLHGISARPNHLPGVCANWFIYMHLWRRLGIVQASLASALALRKRLDNFARFFFTCPARQTPKPHAKKHFLYAFFYPQKPFSLSALLLFNYISNI